MSIIESLGVSLFSIALVFFVLSSIFALIKLLSVILQKIENKKSDTPVINNEDAKVLSTIENNETVAFSSGQLKLFNVDEKTAAMIMAIVSDESKIPLSELCFKSIRAIEK